MKSCPMCGTSAEEDTTVCEKCSYGFKAGVRTTPQLSGSTVVGADQSNPKINGRPTGQTPIIVGWICFGLSVLLLLISFTQGPEAWEVSSARTLAGNPYASPETFSRVADAYARQWMVQMAAGGLFSVFLVLWGVGSIVQAISYIPRYDRDPSS